MNKSSQENPVRKFLVAMADKIKHDDGLASIFGDDYLLATAAPVVEDLIQIEEITSEVLLALRGIFEGTITTEGADTICIFFSSCNKFKLSIAKL